MIYVALVLLSAGFLPELSVAQQVGVGVGSQTGVERCVQLGSNYPNPFNSDTRIPFDLCEELFAEGVPATVSIRIYDILRQYVASPTALRHPAGDGAPVIDLEYVSPGRHEVYWDGRNRFGSVVAAGVYIVELTVNGRSHTSRIFLSN